MSVDAIPSTCRVYTRGFSPAVRLWMFRVLSPVGGVRTLVCRWGSEDEVLMALGIDLREIDASPGPDERIPEFDGQVCLTPEPRWPLQIPPLMASQTPPCRTSGL